MATAAPRNFFDQFDDAGGITSSQAPHAPNFFDQFDEPSGFGPRPSAQPQPAQGTQDALDALDARIAAGIPRPSVVPRPAQFNLRPALEPPPIPQVAQPEPAPSEVSPRRMMTGATPVELPAGPTGPAFTYPSDVARRGRLYDVAQEPSPSEKRIAAGIQHGFGKQPLGLDPAKFADYPHTYSLWQPFVAPIDFAMRAPGGVIGGVAAVTTELYRALGGSDADAARLERDLHIVGQGVLIEPMFGGHHPVDAAHQPPRNAAEFIARADVIDSPAVADFQLRTLREFGGYTDDQLRAMDMRQRQAAYQQWAASTSGPVRPEAPSEPPLALPPPEGATPPVAPATAQPPEAPPPAKPTPTAPQQSPAPQQERPVITPSTQPAPSAEPVISPTLEDIFNDPRSAAQIRADLKAAQNWQATAEWQAAPQGVPLDALETKIEDGNTFARITPALGTREAPVRLESPADVHVGAEQTAQPTPAQAEAGNYQKRHLQWNGLDIAIETEQGGLRTGLDSEGKPWSVEMPHPYGYIKRSEGKDGDQLDITIGPDPNAPAVFVIDQIDPATGKFDEHKSFGGFYLAFQARQAYEASFSDGSGPSRFGAITAMKVPEFKAWVASGDTTKALAYKPPQKPAQKESPPAAAESEPKKSAFFGPEGVTGFVRASQGEEKTFGKFRAFAQRERPWSSVDAYGDTPKEARDKAVAKFEAPKPPVTPQIPPPGGGTKYVLPSFVTAPHAKPKAPKAPKPAASAPAQEAPAPPATPEPAASALPKEMTRQSLQALRGEVEKAPPERKAEIARWIDDQFKTFEREGARIAEACLERGGSFSIR